MGSVWDAGPAAGGVGWQLEKGRDSRDKAEKWEKPSRCPQSHLHGSPRQSQLDLSSPLSACGPPQNPATRKVMAGGERVNIRENIRAEDGRQISQFSSLFPFPLCSSVVALFLGESGCWKTEREDDKHCCGII